MSDLKREKAKEREVNTFYSNKRKEIEQDQKEQQSKEETKQFARELQNREFKHDWKICIVSTLAGAILSKPLWDWVLPWIAQLLIDRS